MRKLTVKMSMSIDGFVSGPNGEKDWVFKTGDEKAKAWGMARVSESGLIIMGRKSFEVMAPYWPTSNDPYAAAMNGIPKAVFTQRGFAGYDGGGRSSAAEASWTQARVIDGDLAAEVSRLKAEEGGPIVAIGGAGFVRSLIATGLVDEFNLLVHPVVLGEGIPIFDGVAAVRYLKLVEVVPFPVGTVGYTYRF